MSEETPEQATSDDTPDRVTGRTITRWEWPLHRVGLAVYVLVLAVYIVRVGVPIDRIGQTGWILVGIVAARLGRPLRDHTRAIADSLGMPVRVMELVDLERSMFGGVLPTTWLQEHFSNPADPQWWDAVASLVYTSHFVVPWALAAVLYVRSRDIWMRYVHRVVLLSYAGLVTYILLPAAPPWYAAHYGFVSDEIGRIITNGWSVLGLRSAGAMIEQAQAGSNPVAALPSLHTAFALLVSITLWTLVRSRAWRVVIAAYPIAMALTLVYGGGHYVIDILLGWLYVGLVLLIAVAR